MLRKQISVMMKPALKAKLDQEAKSQALSRSYVLELALSDYLKKMERARATPTPTPTSKPAPVQDVPIYNTASRTIDDTPVYQAPEV